MKPLAQLHPLVNEAMSYQQHWHYWRHSNTHNLCWFLKSSFNDFHFYGIMKTEWNIPTGKTTLSPKKGSFWKEMSPFNHWIFSWFISFQAAIYSSFYDSKTENSQAYLKFHQPRGMFFESMEKNSPRFNSDLKVTWNNMGGFFSPKKQGEANPPENQHDNGNSPFLIGDMHFKWLVFHRHVSFLGCNCTQTKIHNRNGECTGYMWMLLRNHSVFQP